MKEILFLGGDPVLHPDFYRSIVLAKQMGLDVTVLSNSWSLKPDDAFDAQLKYIDNCEATVLGHTSAFHDKIARQPGGYDLLVANLKRIAKANKPIGVCLNATPKNLPWLYEIIRVLTEDHDISIHRVTIQRIVPSGRAAGIFEFSLHLSDMALMMEQVERIRSHFSVPIHFEDPVPFCVVDSKYHYLLTRCDWGYTKGSVNARGDLTRCAADDHYRLGSIFDGSLQERWKTHPLLLSFRSKKYLSPECQACSLLEQCGGGCPLSCGTSRDQDIDSLYLQRKHVKVNRESPLE